MAVFCWFLKHGRWTVKHQRFWLLVLFNGLAQISGCHVQQLNHQEFHLIDTDLTVDIDVAENDGLLMIAGHITSIEWVGHPPQVYLVGNNLFLVDDSLYGRKPELYLWDQDTKQATAIEGSFFRVGRSNAVIIHRNKFTRSELAVMTINPKTRQVEDIWRDEARLDQNIYPMGLDQGKMYFSVRRGESASILVLSPDQPPIEIEADFPYSPASSGDSVRGDLLLLAKPIAVPSWEDPPREQDMPIYEIACWNIQTKELRILGQVKGHYFIGGLAHPWLTIGWWDDKLAEGLKSGDNPKGYRYPGYCHLVTESMTLVTFQFPRENQVFEKLVPPDQE